MTQQLMLLMTLQPRIHGYIYVNVDVDVNEDVDKDVDNRDKAAENAGGAAEAVEPVANDHAAEEMDAEEESTF